MQFLMKFKFWFKHTVFILIFSVGPIVNKSALVQVMACCCAVTLTNDDQYVWRHMASQPVYTNDQSVWCYMALLPNHNT